MQLRLGIERHFRMSLVDDGVSCRLVSSQCRICPHFHTIFQHSYLNGLSQLQFYYSLVGTHIYIHHSVFIFPQKIALCNLAAHNRVLSTELDFATSSLHFKSHLQNNICALLDFYFHFGWLFSFHCTMDNTSVLYTTDVSIHLDIHLVSRRPRRDSLVGDDSLDTLARNT